jgi:hypothetical protein
MIFGQYFHSHFCPYPFSKTICIEKKKIVMFTTVNVTVLKKDFIITKIKRLNKLMMFKEMFEKSKT